MIENLRKHVNTTKGLANNLGPDTTLWMPFQHVSADLLGGKLTYLTAKVT
jgi:hypothetical protein